ncbi:hypothetical protein ACFQPC_04930 [Herminiimonas glaciei]|uniref:Uncharacterized protein n=1 Tax=Herminiimonas glaciei TaxID=523788 RepID=A0ABW2I8V3_9BURK
MNRSTLMQTEVPILIRDTVLRNKPAPLAPSRSAPALSRVASSVQASASGAVTPISTPALVTNEKRPHECLMLLTISADCVAELRHLVMRTCGEWIVFMRTQPIAHANKMKVWLCLSNSATELVMTAVMRALPSAEFGKITYA